MGVTAESIPSIIFWKSINICSALEKVIITLQEIGPSITIFIWQSTF
jgi:hypothetical protein